MEAVENIEDQREPDQEEHHVKTRNHSCPQGFFSSTRARTCVIPVSRDNASSSRSCKSFFLIRSIASALSRNRFARNSLRSFLTFSSIARSFFMLPSASSDRVVFFRKPGTT